MKSYDLMLKGVKLKVFADYYPADDDNIADAGILEVRANGIDIIDLISSDDEDKLRDMIIEAEK